MDSSSPHTNAVTKISADVLKMNFMKKTITRIERQKKQNERERTKEQISAGKLEVLPPRHYPTVEHIDDDPNITLGGVMTEWRYSVLMDNLRFGRFSFKGQNPEVEKWMQFHERRRNGIEDEEEEEEEEKREEEGEKRRSREEGELSDEEGDGSIVKLVEEVRNEGRKRRDGRKRQTQKMGKRTDIKRRRRGN
ncbi:hypothetical protein niasHS_014606 [Heterodera schachtii]|uniref:Uncharacterized protein n=1 Tax=Heterodera schachtii TaxID=97005 RepID=A0ABD2IF40_HETSC